MNTTVRQLQTMSHKQIHNALWMTYLFHCDSTKNIHRISHKTTDGVSRDTIIDAQILHSKENNKAEAYRSVQIIWLHSNI